MEASGDDVKTQRRRQPSHLGTRLLPVLAKRAEPRASDGAPGPQMGTMAGVVGPLGPPTTACPTSKRALCFKDRHQVAEILQRYGFVVERRRQKEVTTGLVGHVPRLILDRVVSLVYVDFPLRLAKREESFWHRMMTWARFFHTK